MGYDQEQDLAGFRRGKQAERHTVVVRRPRSAPEPQPQTEPPLPEAQPQLPVAGRRKGRDTDIWHLAELFRDLARVDGIELTKGLPVICTEINDLVTLWKLREKRFPHYFEACERRKLPESRAEHCWLHPRQDVRQRDIAWWEMVEVIMMEFWSRRWDAYALDHFRQHFAEYGQMAVKHWASLSAIEKINAQPKVERPVMRRRIPRATMPDVSKEGE